MVSTSAATIVDVLENSLDGDLSARRAERLSLSEVKSLREVVLQFYDAWAPYPGAEGTLRVHLGGWVASAASDGLGRDLLHAALLYAHEVVIHDPVAAYFEPRRRSLRAFRPVVGQGLNLETSQIQHERSSGYEYFGEDHLDAHRSHLALAIPRVASLADLIRGGVVLPIPHLKLTLQRQEKIWTAVRYLLTDDDYARLVDNPIDRPALTADEGPAVLLLTQPRTAEDARIQQYGDAAYYLSRSIAMADVAYASYLPPSATEWAIYQQRLSRLGSVLSRDSKLDLTVAPALLHSDLPYFDGLSSADVLAVRRHDESFEQWRSRLRKAGRQINALPSEGQAFITEAGDVLRDELEETAAEVRQAVSRSAALKRNLRPTTLGLSTGAAGIAGAAALAGGPGALSALTITGMLRWLADSLLAPNLSGSRAVLAHLVHDRSPRTGEGDWPKREPLVLTPKKRPAS
jgi:hypothetical protein